MPRALLIVKIRLLREQGQIARLGIEVGRDLLAPRQHRRRGGLVGMLGARRRIDRAEMLQAVLGAINELHVFAGYVALGLTRAVRQEVYRARTVRDHSFDLPSSLPHRQADHLAVQNPRLLRRHARLRDRLRLGHTVARSHRAQQSALLGRRVECQIQPVARHRGARRVGGRDQFPVAIALDALDDHPLAELHQQAVGSEFHLTPRVVLNAMRRLRFGLLDHALIQRHQ